MSLEESMAALAESNNRLAEANTNAAKLYAALIERLDGAQVEQITTKTDAAETAPARGRGRPKKDAAPAPKQEAEDDGLGGDDEQEEQAASRTSDEVKAILKQFKEAGGVPRDIMSKFGAKSFPEVKESDFNAVYEATEKALARL